MGETEIKLEVDATVRDRVARAFVGPQVVRQRLRAAYWDTPDGRLAERNIALRVRQEGRRWVQTVKGLGESLLHRQEHNVPLPGRWPPGGPAAEPSRHAGTAIGAELQKALKGASAIECRYTTDVLRLRLWVEAGHDAGKAANGSAVEVVFDAGEVRAGEARSPVCEVEIELKRGDAALLFDTARSGIAAHGLWISGVTKSARGERLRRGQTHAEPVKATAPKLVASMNLDAALRSSLAACLPQVLGNAGEVAAGSPNPDHVHQLRVGLRRLRTALSELGSASAGLDPAWELLLAQAFRELGVLRDREVLTASVAPSLMAAGAPAICEPPAPAGARSPRDLVREPGFQQALVDLIEYSMASADLDAPPAKKGVRRALRRLHGKVAREARRFEALPEERQHAVRKLLKRLRYVVEFGHNLFDAKQVARYLERLEPAQDALGRHNDEAVALALYRRAAEAGEGNAWFAVGWLQARQRAGAAECARALERVADSPLFFD